MAIQFSCSGCGNQLSVPDEAAGKKARCPKCSTVVPVPASSDTAVENPPPGVSAGDTSGSDFDDFQLRPEENPPNFGSASPAGSAFPEAKPHSKPNPYSENPYASPAMGYDEPTSTGIKGGEIRPSLIDFGDVFSHSWNLYLQNVGMVLGAVMLGYVLNAVIGYAIGMLNQVVIAVMGNDETAAVIAIGLGFGTQFIQIAIATFINIGVWRILLDVGKGERQDFGKIFSGADLFLPMFGAMLLWMLMVLFGTLLLIIPGIILLLLFGQFHFLMVDQRMGVMDSFSKSYEITHQNWPTLLGIYVVSLLIAIACFITCVPVALIFFGPYISMVWAVMYLKMTGQHVADV